MNCKHNNKNLASHFIEIILGYCDIGYVSLLQSTLFFSKVNILVKNSLMILKKICDQL